MDINGPELEKAIAKCIVSTCISPADQQVGLRVSKYLNHVEIPQDFKDLRMGIRTLAGLKRDPSTNIRIVIGLTVSQRKTSITAGVLSLKLIDTSDTVFSRWTIHDSSIDSNDSSGITNISCKTGSVDSVNYRKLAGVLVLLLNTKWIANQDVTPYIDDSMFIAPTPSKETSEVVK